MRQKYQPHLVALSKLADQLSEDYIRERDERVQARYFDVCRLITNLKNQIIESERHDSSS